MSGTGAGEGGPGTKGATLCFWLATWFGAGLSPLAPGTVGTLAALPVHFVLLLLPASWHLGLVAVLALVGMACADSVARSREQKDPQIIVIDESAGVLLALFLVRDGGWMGIVAAVVLFRVLDIWKPWPIDLLENLRPAGLGIMADDVAAGLLAGSVVWLALGVWG